LQRYLTRIIVNTFEGNNMFHDYVLFTNMGFEEADEAFSEIVESLKS
jgi:hypothetical protein